MTARDLLSVQEAAKLIGISKNTAYDLIKKNKLPSYRIGRKIKVDYQDIQTFLNQGKTDLLQASSLGGTRHSPVSYTAAYTFTEKPLIIAGQAVILDILANHLNCPPYNIPTLHTYCGCYDGLVSLYKGLVSVASAHLWDGDSDTYNETYLKSLLPGLGCTGVNLASRMQGFYVAKGNPKKIYEWSDLANKNVTMINRELGCGVRILIDQKLKKAGIPIDSINGYEQIEYSHIAGASAVSRGDADVSIGNELTALQVSNIDFVPLQKERLDIIIPSNIFDTSPIQSMLLILTNKKFLKEMSGIGCYDLSQTGKVLIKI